MKRFLNWLTGKTSPSKAARAADLSQTGAHLHQSGAHARPGAADRPVKPSSAPEYVDLDPHLEGRIEDMGPGKNVLIRNKFVREDTGTHDTLKILDDSMIDTEEETGIDPYNTGQFDRSKNWDKRFRN